MARLNSFAVVLVALAGIGPAAAQQAEPEPRNPRPAVAPFEPVPWTNVPRRVERRAPTLFQNAPENVNTPVVVSPPPRQATPAIAAATQASAVLELPESGETTYHRAMVVDPGFFQAGEALVRFEGIVPLSIDEHCPGAAAGEAWPCGRRALAALRDLVRQRPLQCVETGRDGNIMVARCRVGRTDVAAWLVERGWARPAGEDQRLQRLMQSARESRIGQFARESGGAPP